MTGWLTKILILSRKTSNLKFCMLVLSIESPQKMLDCREFKSVFQFVWQIDSLTRKAFLTQTLGLENLQVILPLGAHWKALPSPQLSNRSYSLTTYGPFVLFRRTDSYNLSVLFRSARLNAQLYLNNRWLEFLQGMGYLLTSIILLIQKKEMLRKCAEHTNGNTGLWMLFSAAKKNVPLR